MRCLLLLCPMMLLLAGCSKDLIRYQSAQRIETGTSNRLNCIFFANDTLGFAGGGPRFDAAEILITRDGGRSWSLYKDTNARKEIFDFGQAPDGSIYAIGFDGKLLRTSDEGRSWSFRQLRYDAYKAIAFPSATLIEVVGGISFEQGNVTRMDTGGNVVRYDSLGYELNDMVLLSNGQGWRCGYGVMEHTANAGQSWEWQSPRNDNFKSLDVHDVQTAYTCGGEGSIYSTRDGGASWQMLRNGNDLRKPKYHLQDIVFLDAQRGYAVGEEGLMIYTDDQGAHWSELERFTKEHLHGIAQAPNGDILVCGQQGGLWRIVR